MELLRELLIKDEVKFIDFFKFIYMSTLENSMKN